MQQCRILFSEAVDKSDTLHFNIHGWRIHGDCSHVYTMTRKRVFCMSDAISWCWFLLTIRRYIAVRRLRSETAFLLIDEELQWSVETSFLIHLIQIWSLISVCCSYDAHTWSQWQEVFASAYVFVEWFTLGECALQKLITIFSSQLYSSVSFRFDSTSSFVFDSCLLYGYRFFVSFMSAWFDVWHCASSRAGVTFQHYFDWTLDDNRRV